MTGRYHEAYARGMRHHGGVDTELMTAAEDSEAPTPSPSAGAASADRNPADARGPCLDRS